MIYFDNASTTSVRTEVRRVYGQMLETCYGNPDSLHAAGRQASSLMEKSRSNIASMLHVDPSEIIFTSAASESNTLAIVGYALANEHRGHHVLTSNVEHSSVRHAMEFLKRFGFEVEFLPINEEGIVTPECLKSHMRKDTVPRRESRTGFPVLSYPYPGSSGERIPVPPLWRWIYKCRPPFRKGSPASPARSRPGHTVLWADTDAADCPVFSSLPFLCSSYDLLQ